MFTRALVFCCVAASLAHAASVTLLSFDSGSSNASFSFALRRDLVLNESLALSTAAFSLQPGALDFHGTVRDTVLPPPLPYNLPGFCVIETTNPRHFSDLSAYTTLVLVVKSSIDYDGFKVSFADSFANQTDSFLAQASFKAAFSVVASGEWQTVYLPFTAFTNKWSFLTGGATTPCSDQHPQVCPKADNLRNVQQLQVWAEGVDGDFNLQLQSISATNAVPPRPCPDPSIINYVDQTDRFLSPIGCLFSLASLILFAALPKLHSTTLPQLFCLMMTGSLIDNTAGLFSFAVDSYNNAGFCTDAGTLCQVSGTMSVFGFLVALSWNSIFTLHVLFSLKRPELLKWKHLKSVYHAVAWSLAVLVTLHLKLSHSIGHRTDTAKSCFLIQPSVAGWSVAPFIIVLTSAIIIGVVSLYVIIAELSKLGDVSVWARITLVARTSSFVVVFVLFAFWFILSYLLTFDHVHLRVTACIYATFNSIIWFGSQAVRDACAERRQQQANDDDGGWDDVAVAPYSEMRSRPTTHDYADEEDGEYLPRPQLAINAFARDDGGSSVSSSRVSRPQSVQNAGVAAWANQVWLAES